MGTEPVLWAREGHTKAKHDLLLAFFQKWVSVHSETFAKYQGGLVRIYDGFAGPGVYECGEPGSPLILLGALLDNDRLLQRWTSVRYEFTFVERDERRARRLQDELEARERLAREGRRWTDRVSWSVTCGAYEDHAPQPVAGQSALFLFVDPFGYSHSPMGLTTEILKLPKCDTLIFLPLAFVNRFVARSGQEQAMDRFFGTPEWRDVPDGPGRPKALLNLFCKQLVKAGLRYTHRFRLASESNNEYWIVGASDNVRGFESVKEGCWAVDPRHGRGFVPAQAAVPGQGSFGFDGVPDGPDTAPLLAGLRSEFADRWFSVEDAITYTAESTFLPKHLKRLTLVPAEKAQQLEVERPSGAKQFKEGNGIRMRFVRY